MTTPIPRILIALDGRIDCIRQTNPFGGGEDKPKKRQSRSQVERGLKAAFEKRGKR
jgi:hypothetical protein